MMSSGARAAVELVSWWMLLFVLYLVLITTVSGLELVVAAAVSGLAAVGAWGVHRSARPVAGPVGHWMSALWLWPGTVVVETWRLARFTAAAPGRRAAEGRFRTVRLRRGVGAAWACALLSGTPGGCVVDVTTPADAGSGDGTAPTLRIHALFPERSRLEALLTEEDGA
jgi:hypothetical protein